MSSLTAMGPQGLERTEDQPKPAWQTQALRGDTATGNRFSINNNSNQQEMKLDISFVDAGQDRCQVKTNGLCISLSFVLKMFK